MKNFAAKGFTLIELLVVIAVLAVLATGVLVLIDPVDKINAANDSRVQNDLGATGRATETYATRHNGYYPATMQELVDSGELKVVPYPPTGYAYTYTAEPAGCVSAVSCTSVVITSPLKSKLFTATPFQRYETVSNKACRVATAATVCP